MSAEANESLLFQWEAPHRRHLAILGFLAVSALAHAFCFYLFQIVYPPTVSLLPPPGRVHLISGDTEEGRSLLRWIAAEDPALATTTVRSRESKSYNLPHLAHVPSYKTVQPALREMPALTADAPSESLQPPGPVQTTLPAAPPALAPGAARTTLIFSTSFDSLGAVTRPPMTWTASTRETPQSARFLVGVSHEGVVRYCFLEQSSGDTGLDEQARHYLLLCRFADAQKSTASSPNGLNWAAAIIEWGNDIALPPAAPEGRPSP